MKRTTISYQQSDQNFTDDHAQVPQTTRLNELSGRQVLGIGYWTVNLFPKTEMYVSSQKQKVGYRR